MLKFVPSVLWYYDSFLFSVYLSFLSFYYFFSKFFLNFCFHSNMNLESEPGVHFCCATNYLSDPEQRKWESKRKATEHLLSNFY